MDAKEKEEIIESEMMNNNYFIIDLSKPKSGGNFIIVLKVCSYQCIFDELRPVSLQYEFRELFFFRRRQYIQIGNDKFLLGNVNQP
jgi:hypothetical protein